MKQLRVRGVLQYEERHRRAHMTNDDMEEGKNESASLRHTGIDGL
jgi:hypothetical protein